MDAHLSPAPLVGALPPPLPLPLALAHPLAGPSSSAAGPAYIPSYLPHLAHHPDGTYADAGGGEAQFAYSVPPAHPHLPAHLQQPAHQSQHLQHLQAHHHQKYPHQPHPFPHHPLGLPPHLQPPQSPPSPFAFAPPPLGGPVAAPGPGSALGGHAPAGLLREDGLGPGPPQPGMHFAGGGTYTPVRPYGEGEPLSLLPARDALAPASNAQHDGAAGFSQASDVPRRRSPSPSSTARTSTGSTRPRVNSPVLPPPSTSAPAAAAAAAAAAASGSKPKRVRPPAQARPSVKVAPGPRENLTTIAQIRSYPTGEDEERPFQCDLCPQNFNRNHDLKRHRKIHLELKPFACAKCNKNFSRKDALRRHWLVKGCKGGDVPGAGLPSDPAFSETRPSTSGLSKRRSLGSPSSSTSDSGERKNRVAARSGKAKGPEGRGKRGRKIEVLEEEEGEERDSEDEHDDARSAPGPSSYRSDSSLHLPPTFADPPSIAGDPASPRRLSPLPPSQQHISHAREAGPFEPSGLPAFDPPPPPPGGYYHPHLSQQIPQPHLQHQQPFQGYGQPLPYPAHMGAGYGPPDGDDGDVQGPGAGAGLNGFNGAHAAPYPFRGGYPPRHFPPPPALGLPGSPYRPTDGFPLPDQQQQQQQPYMPLQPGELGAHLHPHHHSHPLHQQGLYPSFRPELHAPLPYPSSASPSSGAHHLHPLQSPTAPDGRPRSAGLGHVSPAPPPQIQHSGSPSNAHLHPDLQQQQQQQVHGEVYVAGMPHPLQQHGQHAFAQQHHSHQDAWFPPGRPQENGGGVYVAEPPGRF